MMSAMTEPREFPLADVLSVTTGMVLTRRGGEALDDILNWATGDQLSWWQAPRAADACIEAFTSQHPFLADLVPLDGLDKPDLYAWLLAAEVEHGETVTLTPLADWVHQDATAELLDRVELAQLTAEKPVAILAEELDAMAPNLRRAADIMGEFTTSVDRVAHSVGESLERVASASAGIMSMAAAMSPPASVLDARYRQRQRNRRRRRR